MNLITYPNHLLVTVAISTILLIPSFIFTIRKIKVPFIRWNWITISLFLLSYSTLIGAAILEEVNIQLELNMYDLNQNGIFEVNEITADQKEAMRASISGTGRNLSFLFGLIWSAIFSFPIFIVGYIIDGRKINA